MHECKDWLCHLVEAAHWSGALAAELMQLTPLGPRALAPFQSSPLLSLLLAFALCLPLARLLVVAPAPAYFAQALAGTRFLGPLPVLFARRGCSSGNSFSCSRVASRSSLGGATSRMGVGDRGRIRITPGSSRFGGRSELFLCSAPWCGCWPGGGFGGKLTPWPDRQW